MGQLAGQAIASHVIEPQVVLGADPDYADSDGETALHVACIRGSDELARTMVGNGGCGWIGFGEPARVPTGDATRS